VGQWERLAYSYFLKMEATSSSETLVHFCQTARRSIPGDILMHNAMRTSHLIRSRKSQHLSVTTEGLDHQGALFSLGFGWLFLTTASRTVTRPIF
jgi:hypothetical protein